MTRREALEHLAQRVAALGQSARVAVDGPDAAGKTTLADELTALLFSDGRSVTRITADEFLRPPAERYRRGRALPDGYYADSFDHDALRAAVSAAPGLVLVDGVFLSRPELEDLWTFRIFVSIGDQESLRRGVARDGPDSERLYRVRYLPGQRIYDADARPRERADVVVENDDPARPTVIDRRGVREPGS